MKWSVCPQILSSLITTHWGDDVSMPTCFGVGNCLFTTRADKTT